MKNKKVLVIEDNKSLNEMFVLGFSLKGFEVESALDGEIGLQKISSFKPDIILLDIMMPKVDGRDILQKLYEKKIRGFFVVASNIDPQRFDGDPFFKGIPYIRKSEYTPKEIVMKTIKLYGSV